MQSFLPVPFSFQSSFSSKTHIDGLQMMISKMWTHCTFIVVFSALRVSLHFLFVIVLLEYAGAQKTWIKGDNNPLSGQPSSVVQALELITNIF